VKGLECVFREWDSDLLGEGRKALVCKCIDDNYEGYKMGVAMQVHVLMTHSDDIIT